MRSRYSGLRLGHSLGSRRLGGVCRCLILHLSGLGHSLFQSLSLGLTGCLDGFELSGSRHAVGMGFLHRIRVDQCLQCCLPGWCLCHQYSLGLQMPDPVLAFLQFTKQIHGTGHQSNQQHRRQAYEPLQGSVLPVYLLTQHDILASHLIEIRGLRRLYSLFGRLRRSGMQQRLHIARSGFRFLCLLLHFVHRLWHRCAHRFSGMHLFRLRLFRGRFSHSLVGHRLGLRRR